MLSSHGLSKGLCLWMTTNIRVVSGGGYTWRFDIATVEQLFQSFLRTSFYNLLRNPPSGTSINIVRASRNPLWTDKDIKDLSDMEKQSNGSVKLTVIEGGHWLHVDNPEGLWKAVSPSFK